MNKPEPVSRIILPGERSGSVRIPSSKSAAHRILICAALGNRPVTVQLDGLSQDIFATAECLRALGAGIEQDDRELRVQPLDRDADPKEAVLPAGKAARRCVSCFLSSAPWAGMRSLRWKGGFPAARSPRWMPSFGNTACILSRMGTGSSVPDSSGAGTMP